MLISRASAWLLVGFLQFGPATGSADEIVIAATDWEPFTSATLPGGGFLTEIAVAALERVGHEPRVEIMPWVRALEGTKEGTFDALLGASYTQARTEHFHYPRTIYSSQSSFFAVSGRYPDYQRPEDLCPATVGILRGSFLVEVLEPVNCLKQELAADVRTNVRKLLHGRIELIVDSKVAVLYYLKQELPDQPDAIEEISPALIDDPLYLVVSKRRIDYERIAADYDRGLELIQADGTYDAILERYGLLDQ